MLIQIEVQMQLAIVVLTVLICHRSQEFLNGILDQEGIAKDTHDLNNRSVQFEVVFNNGNKTVRDDGDMYLNSDCILRFTPKGFDAKVLLDPFEKQFDLPSVAIKKGDFRITSYNVCYTKLLRTNLHGCVSKIAALLQALVLSVGSWGLQMCCNVGGVSFFFFCGGKKKTK